MGKIGRIVWAAAIPAFAAAIVFCNLYPTDFLKLAPWKNAFLIWFSVATPVSIIAGIFSEFTPHSFSDISNIVLRFLAYTIGPLALLAALFLDIWFIGERMNALIPGWIYSMSTHKNSFTVRVTLLLGVALFLFRFKFRVIYGFTEVCAGLLLAYRAADSSKNPFPLTDPIFLFLLTASAVYIVVRGIDNMHQGVTKHPQDAFVLYLKERALATLNFFGIEND
ncbi:MAG: hypothetical protein PW999_16110 [Paraburkholderia tropica]|nr:hypothetical protein [Paraburkholderia tropica]